MSRRTGVFVPVVMVASVISRAAHADELFLGGAQYGANASYSYIGSVIPLPGSTLGSGFAARLWGDYLTYNYRTGSAKIDAAGWGGELAGVYQFSGAWGWSDLSAGARYRDTNLSPDDPNNRARGSHVYLTLQADGGYNLDANWRFRGIASYTPLITGYFIQPAIDRAISQSVRAGLDVTFQGDRSYKQVYAGANVTIIIDDRRSVGLRAGTMTSGGGSGLYAGISFVLTGS
jgi:hypothetical protein